jgi:hypothetical protein
MEIAWMVGGRIVMRSNEKPAWLYAHRYTQTQGHKYTTNISVEGRAQNVVP